MGSPSSSFSLQFFCWRNQVVVHVNVPTVWRLPITRRQWYLSCTSVRGISYKLLVTSRGLFISSSASLFIYFFCKSTSPGRHTFRLSLCVMSFLLHSCLPASALRWTLRQYHLRFHSFLRLYFICLGREPPHTVQCPSAWMGLFSLHLLNAVHPPKSNGVLAIVRHAPPTIRPPLPPMRLLSWWMGVCTHTAFIQSLPVPDICL